MHFRTLIDFDNCFLINAGTLKGDWAGITVLDLKTREVAGFNLLDDGQVSATLATAWMTARIAESGPIQLLLMGVGIQQVCIEPRNITHASMFAKQET